MSKIWDYDCYDLRKFKPGEIDFFLDIGANVGTVSLQAKVLLPKAKVISLEPARDTFEILERNMQQWKSTGIKLYNVALGDGSLMSFHRKGKAGSGMNRFYNQDEKDKWRKNYEYEIESKTIKQIFEDYKIDVEKKYIIKIDCEGGERHLLQQEKDFTYYVKNSVQVMMEIHRGLGGGESYDGWNEWFKKIKDTHTLKLGTWIDKHTSKQKYVYVPIEKLSGESLEKRWVSIELVNKKWGNKF